jgi:phosphoribosylformylglycinamidine synthase
MCVGIVQADRLVRARASGVGNPVIAVGSRTGRDGIHGATFASEELGDETHESRPQVQVGDPFTEKLLLEATLELLDKDLVVAIQDMGAAGLTSSASEMAARGGTGIEIDIGRVPVREEGMTPYEILLSESQERMLLIAEAGKEDAVRDVLDKWDLEAVVVGRVTDDGLFRVVEDGTLVASVPVPGLVDEAPIYELPARESARVAELRATDVETVAADADVADPSRAWLRLLSAPTIASKRWVYRQYDTTVGTRTVAGPGGDAAVLRLPRGGGGVAITTDGNGRYVYLNPLRGGMIAVCEAARNLACVGARPLAITNCLNFGTPGKPEVYHQFREAVEGMSRACETLGTPVTGGNVSFYNESPRGAVYPTPVVGMVGLLEDVERAVPAGFQAEGDAILLLGPLGAELGGSEYLKTIAGRVVGDAPAVDLELHRRLIDLLVRLAGEGRLRSAHDCSEGGVAIALAEAAILDPEQPRGFLAIFDVERFPEIDGASVAASLFGESQGRVVISVAPNAIDTVSERAVNAEVPCRRLGTVKDAESGLEIRIGELTVRLDAAEAVSAYYESIASRMERLARGEDAA